MHKKSNSTHRKMNSDNNFRASDQPVNITQPHLTIQSKPPPANNNCVALKKTKVIYPKKRQMQNKEIHITSAEHRQLYLPNSRTIFDKPKKSAHRLRI